MNNPLNELLSVPEAYNFSPTEKLAWKLLCFYVLLGPRFFPNYHAFPKVKSLLGGDPRKKAGKGPTVLFRYCYKAVTEMDLDPTLYKHYVTAQFQVMQNMIKSSDGEYADPRPSILAGQQAWKRWLSWKRKYEKELAKPTTAPAVNDSVAVRRHLAQARVFLLEKIGSLAPDSIRTALADGKLLRWAVHGQVSPFFLALSPTVGRWRREGGDAELQRLNIDLNLYRTGPEAESLFRERFPLDCTED